MIFPEFNGVTPQTLKELQHSLKLTNHEIAALVGVSTKTWLNRISAPENTEIKLLSKLEYQYLKERAERAELSKSTSRPNR